MDEEEQTVEEVATEEHSDPNDKDSRTWYPYITKAQFEKFLARMQSKMPEEINRDYIRAIIRTPSMIYRFLRGIEAMKLIDQDQRPTERMVNLVNADTRQQTIAEIMRDLYPDLTESQEKENGGMPDSDIVAFFRKETGMGNDSANKMKMFYKYLLSEAGDQGAAGETDDSTTAETEESSPSNATTTAAEAPTRSERNATAAPTEAPTRRERNAAAAEAARNERNAAAAAEAPTRSERNATTAAAETPARERSGGPGRRGQQRAATQSNGGEPTPDKASTGGTRALSEAQRAYLDTLKAVLRVNIDGDWDDDMIRLAFDRLERLFDRVKRG